MKIFCFILYTFFNLGLILKMKGIYFALRKCISTRKYQPLILPQVKLWRLKDPIRVGLYAVCKLCWHFSTSIAMGYNIYILFISYFSFILHQRLVPELEKEKLCIKSCKDFSQVEVSCMFTSSFFVAVLLRWWHRTCTFLSKRMFAEKWSQLSDFRCLVELYYIQATRNVRCSGKGMYK